LICSRWIPALKEIVTYYIPRSGLLIFCIGAVAFTAHADDWPCWRGSNGDGISRESLWNPAFLQDGPDIAWSVNVGQGHSAVSIANGLLYTHGSGYLGKRGKKSFQEIVYCLDASTGKELWRYGYPSKSLSYSGPRATPLVDGSRLFTLGAQGHLHCFECRTGKVLWNKDLVAERLSRNTPWGFCGSPVVHGDTLLLNVGGSGLALNKRTGSVIWESGYLKCSVPTPVLAEIHGKPAALMNTERILYAVEIWSFPWSYCDADPVVIQDKLFLFGGKPGNQRCRTLINIADGKSEAVWPEKEMNVAFQTWIASRGYVYGITWDKRRHRLQCIDLESGAFTWRREIDDWGSLTMAGDCILFIEGDGELVIFKASPDSYQELSRVRIMDVKSFDDYPKYQPNACWTAPVLCNGKIYIRNSYGDIVCVDSTAQRSTPASGRTP
jgi:outer membrane protein assembly factor BamB